MGTQNRELYIRDSFFHQTDNEGILNFPTFVYSKEGIYPDQIQVFAGEDDPSEQYLHENQIPKQFNEEDAPLDEEGPKDMGGADEGGEA